MSSLLARFIVLVVTLSVATGCGGNSYDGSVQPLGLSVSPTSISFQPVVGQQATVQLAGIRGSVQTKLSDPRIATVGNVSVSGDSGSATIGPIAGGTTTITFTDSSGATAILTVNVTQCGQPTPRFIVAYPAPGATSIPTAGTSVYAYLPPSDPLLSDVTAYKVRLVAGTGVVLEGGFFSLTASSPPPGSAPVQAGYAGGSIAVATLPALSSGSSYQIQLYTPGEVECIPPFIIGTFST